MSAFLKQLQKASYPLLIAVVFFAACSGFIYASKVMADGTLFTKWLSPDETANYVFAKLYGEEGRLTIEERYNRYVKDIMMPRSFRSDFGFLKPVSFLGLPIIYGTLVGLSAVEILPFLTPFFAALGIIHFYFLIRRLFGSRNAVLSSVLLATLPPLLYYSVRSMFHNVLFVSLLIIALCYSLIAIDKKRDWQRTWREQPDWIGLLSMLVAGLAAGAALTVRSSEAIWVIPLFVFLWLTAIRRCGISKPLLFLAGLFLALLPMLYHNQILYGSWQSGGYPQMNQSIFTIAQAGSDALQTAVLGKLSSLKTAISQATAAVFHFGFHPRQSARYLLAYGPQFLPWLFWPGVLGSLIMLFDLRKPKRRWTIVRYLTAWLFITAVLGLFYGSWEFYDNPDRSRQTIGNSYTRYWLPIYIGFLPFVSALIIRLSVIFRQLVWHIFTIWRRAQIAFTGRSVRAAFQAAAIIVLCFFSLGFVLYGSEEGLIHLYTQQRQAQNEWQKLLLTTETNATVITRYHDKLLFPERKVIVGLFDDPNMIEQYVKVAQRLPLYYYNFTFPDKDLEYLNNRRLPPYGLKLVPKERIAPDFTLYRLNLMPDITAASTTIATSTKF